MLKRILSKKLKAAANSYPVVTLTGPRQSGKTTLCKMTFPKMHYVSLEDTDSRNFAATDPRGFLKQYTDGVIIDEIQRAPDLTSHIQGIVDEKGGTGHFILTGSRNFEVMEAINQSLAGRTALLKLLPLSFDEIKSEVAKSTLENLLIKGFYPRLYDKKLNPTEALGFYFHTYVERDIRQISQIHNLSLFEKFTKLCAGRVGQILNLSSLANDVGISHTAAREWLTVLEASYIIFLLKPYHRNFNKRIIKSPKLYFYDVGLAAYLAEIQSPKQMYRDPLKGHLFENLIITETMKYYYNRGMEPLISFYRDSNGNEVDLLVKHEGKLTPIEIKSAQTIVPDFFKGINNFQKFCPDKISKSFILYGGEQQQNREHITVMSYRKMLKIFDL